jgi:hypothetical protein
VIKVSFSRRRVVDVASKECGGAEHVLGKFILAVYRTHKISLLFPPPMYRDDKENKKHALGARRLADKAAVDHAFMMRAYRV